MAGLFADIGASFVLGILTPLTAVCVLPLYPGFLTYLANKLGGESSDRKTYALFGLIATLGVIAFMLLIGIVFTTLFQASLTNVINIVSPIAFGILFVISLLLIFDVDFGRFIPKAKTPKLSKNPLVSAFSFGFFFGAIVLPCNPAFIAAFFARAATTTQFLSGMTNFLGFGFGLGFPLLAFSLISSGKSTAIIGWLTKHKRIINLVAGIFMLLVSLYYLFCIFEVFSSNPVVDTICMPLKAIFGSITQFGSSLL
ncbi:cytochrome C biogenesis protein [Candidatus Woesearchaeota archaeon]|jgi:cytochrome c-type biogenesis protein|nr:cytochrome C biogenesis protein [Candidatus Woesearchaeota archaeon]|tara:strand:+ start:6348 stop:7112 length:765 start_codon:yes stop_codon:yes gene_type:complete